MKCKHLASHTCNWSLLPCVPHTVLYVIWLSLLYIIWLVLLYIIWLLLSVYHPMRFCCCCRRNFIVENQPAPTNHAYLTGDLELHTDQPYMHTALDVSIHCNNFYWSFAVYMLWLQTTLERNPHSVSSQQEVLSLFLTMGQHSQTSTISW